jgi:hypothetical protein
MIMADHSHKQSLSCSDNVSTACKTNEPQAGSMTLIHPATLGAWIAHNEGTPKDLTVAATVHALDYVRCSVIQCHTFTEPKLVTINLNPLRSSQFLS